MMIREWIHDRRTTLNRKQERKMRLILVNVYEHHLLYKKYHNRKIHIIVPWDESFIPSHPMDPCFVPSRPMGHSRQIICPIPSHRSMFRPNTSHGIFRRSNFVPWDGMGWDGMGRDGIVPSHSELWCILFLDYFIHGWIISRF